MKVFKLFYLFSFLLAIKFCSLSLCNTNLTENQVGEELETLLSQEDLDAQKRKRNLILYSAIASATAIALATVAGVGAGLYFRNKKNKKVWESEKEGYAAGKIYNEVLQKSRVKIEETVKSGKDYSSAVPSRSEIAKMIKEESKNLKELSAGQVKTLISGAANAIRLQLINENPHKGKDPQNNNN